jgi:hypothetical protein
LKADPVPFKSGGMQSRQSKALEMKNFRGTILSNAKLRWQPQKSYYFFRFGNCLLELVPRDVIKFVLLIPICKQSH